jgi:predicted aldo/keto reductase-like oxidoreductase
MAFPAEGSFLHQPAGAFGKPVCRLGLASHDGAKLTVADVHGALDRGVNFLNWAGTEDTISRTIAGLGSRREQVVVCVQFGARSAAESPEELRSILSAIGSDYVDVVTFYYVETAEEWAEIIGPAGALEYCRSAQKAGHIRRIGLTTHQRPLAAQAVRSGLTDLLMIRYNAAHRGAEQEVFPVAEAAGLPIIAYTAQRWGALVRSTPDDPAGFAVPPAPAWYRFALQSPAVTVVLAAPHTREELEEDLTVLEVTEPLASEEFNRLAEHGQRVRRHAGRFP